MLLLARIIPHLNHRRRHSSLVSINCFVSLVLTVGVVVPFVFIGTDARRSTGFIAITFLLPGCFVGTLGSSIRLRLRLRVTIDIRHTLILIRCFGFHFDFGFRLRLCFHCRIHIGIHSVLRIDPGVW